MQIAVTILHLIFSISLIVIVLLQSGRRAGLSGSIAAVLRLFLERTKEGLLMLF